MVYDAVIYPHAKEDVVPNIRLAHPELSPNAAVAAAKVSPEIRELIKRSGKKPVREYTLGEEIFNAVTHGVGAGLAVAALVLLIVKSVSDGGGILLAAALVYATPGLISLCCAIRAWT